MKHGLCEKKWTYMVLKQFHWLMELQCLLNVPLPENSVDLIQIGVIENVLKQI